MPRTLEEAAEDIASGCGTSEDAEMLEAAGIDIKKLRPAPRSTPLSGPWEDLPDGKQ